MLLSRSSRMNLSGARRWASASIRERAVYPADFITLSDVSMKKTRLFQTPLYIINIARGEHARRREIVNVTASSRIPR